MIYEKSKNLVFLTCTAPSLQGPHFWLVQTDLLLATNTTLAACFSSWNVVAGTHDIVGDVPKWFTGLFSSVCARCGLSAWIIRLSLCSHTHLLMLTWWEHFTLKTDCISCKHTLSSISFRFVFFCPRFLFRNFFFFCVIFSLRVSFQLNLSSQQQFVYVSEALEVRLIRF